MVMARLPEDFTAWTRELTAEWIEWAKSSGVDVVGDLGDLVPPPAEDVRWADPDRPKPRAVASAAIDALAAATVEAARLESTQGLTSKVDRISRKLRRR
jgi:hypothetical protein